MSETLPTGDDLVNRARALVRSLSYLTVLDAATVLILALACLASARAKGMTAEAYAEQVKQSLIEQVKRMEGRD